MAPDEEDPDEEEPDETEPRDSGTWRLDAPCPDEPELCDREDEEPEPVWLAPVLLALAVLLALLCDDPGSTAASAPVAAALAMPIPAVIAVSRRSPRLRSADGEWVRRGGRSGMAVPLVCGRRGPVGAADRSDDASRTPDQPQPFF